MYFCVIYLLYIQTTTQPRLVASRPSLVHELSPMTCFVSSVSHPLTLTQPGVSRFTFLHVLLDEQLSDSGWAERSSLFYYNSLVHPAHLELLS